MAQLYFNIPFVNIAALVELQNLLRRSLSSNVTYNPPETFHMTLVNIEDDKGVDLKFDDLANDLPAFGVGGNYISCLRTPDGWAYIIRIGYSSQLNYLQSAIYYRAQAAGAKVAGFSYPSNWLPHITLATASVQPNEDDMTYFEANVHLPVNEFALTGEGSFEPVTTWALRTDVAVQEFLNKLTPNVEGHDPRIRLQEQAQTVDNRVQIEMTCVGEMKGGYPNLPLPDDIDVTAIQAQGMKFVTLPIGEVDARSMNGRNYRLSAYKDMVEQINSNRPEGDWGHIKEEDMGTAYGPPAIRWLVAKIDKDGVVWGKGLPLTAAANAYFEMARATNARTGTSLHAWAEVENDDVIGMQLIKLDLADPARVGVPMTAAKPQLSDEMQQKPPASTSAGRANGEGQSSVAEGQKAQGAESGAVTPADLSSKVPEEENPMPDVSEQVTALEQERKTLKARIDELEKGERKHTTLKEDVAEICKLFGVPADADLLKSFRNLKEQSDEMVKENISLLAETTSALIQNKVKIESARPMIALLVAAQQPATKRKLEAAVEMVLNTNEVKELLKAKLVEEAGEAQTPPPGADRETTQEQSSGSGSGKVLAAAVAKFLLPKPEGVSV